jgi:hypothetical protein
VQLGMVELVTKLNDDVEFIRSARAPTVLYLHKYIRGVHSASASF